MPIRSLALMGLLLILVGCGNKGPVRPYQEKLPKAVQSLKLLQRGAELQLRWKNPQKNQDGSPLVDLDHVSVKRLFSSEGEFCAECTDPWPIIARINPDLPAPAQRVGNLFLLSDTGANVGQTARYRLQPRNNLGHSGIDTTVAHLVRNALAPPTGLNITSHNKSIELRWQPATIPDGAKLLGYQIYRRINDSSYLPLAINLRPIKKTLFSDFGLKNSSTYHYRIRSLFNFAGQTVESLPSLEVSAQPSAG